MNTRADQGIWNENGYPRFCVPIWHTCKECNRPHDTQKFDNCPNTECKDKGTEEIHRNGIKCFRLRKNEECEHCESLEW